MGFAFLPQDFGFLSGGEYFCYFCIITSMILLLALLDAIRCFLMADKYRKSLLDQVLLLFLNLHIKDSPLFIVPWRLFCLITKNGIICV